MDEKFELKADCDPVPPDYYVEKVLSREMLSKQRAAGLLNLSECFDHEALKRILPKI